MFGIEKQEVEVEFLQIHCRCLKPTIKIVAYRK